MEQNTPNKNNARNVDLLRYGLAILLTGFLFREAVYVSNTAYPSWLLMIVFVSVILLLLPYEQFLSRLR